MEMLQKLHFTSEKRIELQHQGIRLCLVPVPHPARAFSVSRSLASREIIRNCPSSLSSSLDKALCALLAPHSSALRSTYRALKYVLYVLQTAQTSREGEAPQH